MKTTIFYNTDIIQHLCFAHRNTFVQKIYYCFIIFIICKFLQSCRTTTSTNIGLDLNSYQTAKTIGAGSISTSVSMGISQAIGGITESSGVRQTFDFSAFMLRIGTEVGITDSFDIGLEGNLGIMPHHLFSWDNDLGMRLWTKVNIASNSQSNTALAVLLTGGFQSGNKDNTTFYSVVDSVKWDRTIASQLWRVGISTPLSFSVNPNVDVILHPGIHLMYSRFIYTQTPQSGSKTLQTLESIISYHYAVPSLSIGLRRFSKTTFHPEVTIFLINKKIMATLGFSLRFSSQEER